VFWNGLSSFPFGPLWGGYFNPLDDALIFLGALEIARRKGGKALAAVFFFLLLGMAPGGFSRNSELHRVLPALALLCWIAAGGLQSLLGNLKSRKIIGVGALVLLSAAFDFFHFAYRYCDPNFAPPGKQWRSVEYDNAYEALNHLRQRNGPMDIFTEWNPDYDDKTLNVAVYPFNALDNPQIPRSQVGWVSFLIDVDYTPFLKKTFPEVQAYWLNPDLPPNDSHRLLGLFLIPAREIPPAVLAQWIDVHQACEQISFSIKNKDFSGNWTAYEKPFASLAAGEKDDRFLTALLWERASAFPLMDGNFLAAAADFQKAVQKGYPVPHLLHNLKLASDLSRGSFPKPR
jgi:hypothetical protein